MLGKSLRPYGNTVIYFQTKQYLSNGRIQDLQSGTSLNRELLQPDSLFTIITPHLHYNGRYTIVSVSPLEYRHRKLRFRSMTSRDGSYL